MLEYKAHYVTPTPTGLSILQGSLYYMANYTTYMYIHYQHIHEDYPWNILELSWHGNLGNGTYDQRMVNWRFGLVVWDPNGVPLSDSPFHKGIAGIQTTGTQTTN